MGGFSGPTPHWLELKHMASPNFKANGKCSPVVYPVGKGEIHILLSPSNIYQSGILEDHLEIFKLGSIFLGAYPETID